MRSRFVGHLRIVGALAVIGAGLCLTALSMPVATPVTAATPAGPTSAASASSLPTSASAGGQATPTAFVQSLPKGKSSFHFVDRAGDPSRPVKVWMFVPGSCDASCPLQFVMHGVKRNGEEYLDNWVGLGSEHAFIVIAPEFSRIHFPKDDDYSLGRSTVEPDPSKWAFAVPEHLFAELKSRYSLSAAGYRLFGHSAGGQFVHRMHLFFPNHRADPIIAANPGWYTLPSIGLTADDPSFKFTFPHTTTGSKVDDTRLRQALSRKFVLMLGDKDIDPNDPSLNRSRLSDAQGTFRFERGQHFYAVAERAAKALKVDFAWSKVIVPGVAHENAGMAKAAIKLMVPSNDK